MREHSQALRWSCAARADHGDIACTPPMVRIAEAFWIAVCRLERFPAR